MSKHSNQTENVEFENTPQITYWLHKECLCDTGWKPALNNQGSTSGNLKESQKEGNRGIDQAWSLMPFTSLLRYFSLDQTDGPTDRPTNWLTDIDIHRAASMTKKDTASADGHLL